MHLTHTQRQILTYAGFFILPLATSLHMQTYLGGVLKARDTHSMWLENGRKFCYMGHRRWLLENHPFRFDDMGFDGKVELGCASNACSGSDVLEQLEGIRFSYGKGEAQYAEIDEKDEE